MGRFRRTVFGVLASASLLGFAGMGIAGITAAAPAGVVAGVSHPTAVEYGATAIEY